MGSVAHLNLAPQPEHRWKPKCMEIQYGGNLHCNVMTPGTRRHSWWGLARGQTAEQ